jgi:hypothetical protein
MAGMFSGYLQAGAYKGLSGKLGMRAGNGYSLFVRLYLYLLASLDISSTPIFPKILGLFTSLRLIASLQNNASLPRITNH